MSYQLSEFHEAVRALLGDEGDEIEGYDYRAAQLDSALRTVVRMGFLPCLSLDSGSPPVALVEAPANPDTWAYLAAKAAHILVGGSSPVSFRTRALSVTTEAAARRDTLSYIEKMISDIDARGNVCGKSTDVSHKGLFAAVGDVITYCKLPSCQ